MPGSPASHLVSAALYTLLVFTVVPGVVLAGLWFTLSSQKNRGLLTEHHLVLSPAGIAAHSSFGNSEYSWAGVVAISSTARYIFIYAQQHGAYVIPKASFPTSQAAQAFLAEALRLWEAARAA
jgi:hypothetical protein